jgi:hypothetical protein
MMIYLTFTMLLGEMLMVKTGVSDHQQAQKTYNPQPNAL